MRLMHMVTSFGVRPVVINVLLSWSVRWKEYSTESFKDLRKVVNRSIDPLYPSGIPENKPKTAAISILAKA
jgi:hypothetical protein